jgi:hypothetical protein
MLSIIIPGWTFGDRILLAERFPAPFQTVSGAHSSSYTMGTLSFLEGKQMGVALTTNIHLAPRLRKERSYPSTPPLCFHSLF